MLRSDPCSVAANARSLRALDLLAFCVADIQGGVGPFLVVFLAAALHWSPAAIGTVMFATGLAGVAAQAPAGALIDATRHKRLVTAAASALIAACCLVIIVQPTYAVIVSAQSFIAIAGAVLPPALAAISLGLVGRRAIEPRIGRNQALIAAGSVTMALAVGLFVGQRAIFCFVAVMSVPCLAGALAIRENDIDHALARGADIDGAPARISRVSALLRDRRVLAFAVSAILFHFANASLLTLVGQVFAADAAVRASLYMSAAVVITQTLCMLLGVAIGRWAHASRRKPIFLIAFAVLPLRCLLYTVSHAPHWLLPLQVLDGIGAGVFGVMQVLVVADLTRGTGRFNLTLGALGTAVGIGAALSNLVAGFVVKHAGYDAAFLAMGGISLAALAVFALCTPETRAPDVGRAGRLDVERRGQALCTEAAR
jgi:MFS family permease